MKVFRKSYEVFWSTCLTRPEYFYNSSGRRINSSGVLRKSSRTLSNCPETLSNCSGTVSKSSGRVSKSSGRHSMSSGSLSRSSGRLMEVLRKSYVSTPEDLLTAVSCVTVTSMLSQKGSYCRAVEQYLVNVITATCCVSVSRHCPSTNGTLTGCGSEGCPGQRCDKPITPGGNLVEHASSIKLYRYAGVIH